ncbi:TPA: Mu-like prophage major head subunit gpT family protein [Aeromonas dhakensis]|uniref:Mu-like prophage major head subunit gpT family protein n=1 Tax=Aeromonas dhakensis TaxID=196024 RepID=UPI0020B3AEDE|nr:Mu-like prophage major head subunit gpT family protein [Aeromonas dhakensis]CAD7510918.1 head protein [Aeromonas dhakensis]CAD7524646.1 head protein [Aeromonas dhakensis]HDX8448066.1 Mu-like prophage major head subunit gpT family protein [Aeromonas dhakensis]HDX8517242.1 Mu-like prophage major head subunit gpT family protein [Aeromonas dhakensis]HDX9005267.1 Mu-like prophage major head subunit gpT family protein [Aeromonas dhakensis]
MAIVTPALLQALFTGFKKNFEDAKGEAPAQYTKIATVIKSTTKSNTYGWLGKFPNLRKWVGDRVIESMKAHGYQIVNEDFEATVGVDRNDIEDDELGIYAPMFAEMGRSAGIHPDELCFGLLGAGFTTPCYDGQYFFDTDHPVYPKADGTGTPVLSANVVVDAGYQGEPWFLLDTSRALKPVIFQDRKSPQLIAMTKVDDEAVFTRKEFRYGVDCRDAAGFGFWQLAFANKRALTPDNLWDSFSKMREFQADGGRKLGVKATLLVVPPSLEKLATQMLERELANSSSNELKGKLELVVADYL